MFSFSHINNINTNNKFEVIMVDYKTYIKEVPDFPVEGVNFKDISPLLRSTHWKLVIKEMGGLVEIPDYWVGVDARGFLFASALSYKFGGGIIMCRKKGKLPPETISYKYKTEYSEDELEIQIGEGNVVVVDDVLATGGTMQAVNDLCNNAGYKVKDNLVLVDLEYIPRVSWFDLNVRSLLQYESVR